MYCTCVNLCCVLIVLRKKLFNYVCATILKVGISSISCRVADHVKHHFGSLSLPPSPVLRYFPIFHCPSNCFVSYPVKLCISAHIHLTVYSSIFISVTSNFFSFVAIAVAEWLKEYSSLQENPYIARYIHTVLIIHIYFAPQAVDNV